MLGACRQRSNLVAPFPLVQVPEATQVPDTVTVISYDHDCKKACSHQLQPFSY